MDSIFGLNYSKRLHAYCLNDLCDVLDDIDMDNPHILDKILLGTKEMREYGINNFQTSNLDELASLNFGGYKVRSVHFMGIDTYTLSPRIAKVYIKLLNSHYDEAYIVIGETRILNYGKDVIARFATLEETELVVKYMNNLIAKGKEEYEKNKALFSMETFTKMCEDYCKEYVDGTKYNVVLRNGKSQSGYSGTALVVNDGGTTLYDQIGYIIVSNNSKYQYTFVVNALGISYDVTLTDVNDYKEKLKDALIYLGVNVSC